MAGGHGETGILEQPHGAVPQRRAGPLLALGVHRIALQHGDILVGGPVDDPTEQGGGDPRRRARVAITKHTTDHRGPSTGGSSAAVEASSRVWASRGKSRRGPMLTHPTGPWSSRAI